MTINKKSSRLELIDYFNLFPLLSSKHLDFLAWKEANTPLGQHEIENIDH